MPIVGVAGGLVAVAAGVVVVCCRMGGVAMMSVGGGESSTLNLHLAVGCEGYVRLISNLFRHSIVL